jgi:acetyl-CoA acetyltransferase
MATSVCVLAVAERTTDNGWHEDPEQFVQPVVHAALRDAGLLEGAWPTFSVTASSDFWDGAAYSEQPIGEVLGAHHNTSLKVNEDGLQALALAVAAIEAGETESALVVAHCIPSRHRDRAAVLGRSVEPFWQRRLGLEFQDIEALVRDYWLRRMKWTDADLEEWRATAWERTMRRRDRDLILRRHDVDSTYAQRSGSGTPALLDGAVAVVLGRAEVFPAASSRIAGMGFSTTPTRIGEAPVAGVGALRSACNKALGDAGVSWSDVEVVEWNDRFDYHAPLWAHEVLARDGKGPTGVPPVEPVGKKVNASGGTCYGVTPIVSGLGRLVACHRRLAADEPGISAERPGRRYGLAHGCQGLAAASHSVVILEKVGKA